jgi:UrcA family protein
MLRFNKFLAPLVVAAATVTAGAALATPTNDGNDTTVRAVVSYGDLNLGTAEGAAMLRSRLDWAVSHVEGWADMRDLKAQAARQRCHRRAMEMADALIAAQRANIAFAGPTVLNVG